MDFSKMDTTISLGGVVAEKAVDSVLTVVNKGLLVAADPSEDTSKATMSLAKTGLLLFGSNVLEEAIGESVVTDTIQSVLVAKGALETISLAKAVKKDYDSITEEVMTQKLEALGL